MQFDSIPPTYYEAPYYNPAIKQTSHELDLLLAYQYEYFEEFRDKLINADVDANVYALDFIQLNIDLGNLIAQATKVQGDIRDVNRTNPEEARQFKVQYDQILTELISLMEPIISDTAEGLKEQVKVKALHCASNFLDFAGRIDLQNSIGQMQLITNQIEEQLIRIQNLQLFHL